MERNYEHEEDADIDDDQQEEIALVDGRINKTEKSISSIHVQSQMERRLSRRRSSSKVGSRQNCAAHADAADTGAILVVVASSEESDTAIIPSSSLPLPNAKLPSKAPALLETNLAPIDANGLYHGPKNNSGSNKEGEEQIPEASSSSPTSSRKSSSSRNSKRASFGKRLEKQEHAFGKVGARADIPPSQKETNPSALCIAKKTTTTKHEKIPKLTRRDKGLALAGASSSATTKMTNHTPTVQIIKPRDCASVSNNTSTSSSLPRSRSALKQRLAVRQQLRSNSASAAIKQQNAHAEEDNGRCDDNHLSDRRRDGQSSSVRQPQRSNSASAAAKLQNTHAAEANKGRRDDNHLGGRRRDVQSSSVRHPQRSNSASAVAELQNAHAGEANKGLRDDERLSGRECNGRISATTNNVKSCRTELTPCRHRMSSYPCLNLPGRSSLSSAQLNASRMDKQASDSSKPLKLESNKEAVSTSSSSSPPGQIGLSSQQPSTPRMNKQADEPSSSSSLYQKCLTVDAPPGRVSKLSSQPSTPKMKKQHFDLSSTPEKSTAAAGPSPRVRTHTEPKLFKEPSSLVNSTEKEFAVQTATELFSSSETLAARLSLGSTRRSAAASSLSANAKTRKSCERKPLSKNVVSSDSIGVASTAPTATALSSARSNTKTFHSSEAFYSSEGSSTNRLSASSSSSLLSSPRAKLSKESASSSSLGGGSAPAKTESSPSSVWTLPFAEGLALTVSLGITRDSSSSLSLRANNGKMTERVEPKPSHESASSSILGGELRPTKPDPSPRSTNKTLSSSGGLTKAALGLYKELPSSLTSPRAKAMTKKQAELKESAGGGLTAPTATGMLSPLNTKTIGSSDGFSVVGSLSPSRRQRVDSWNAKRASSAPRQRFSLHSTTTKGMKPSSLSMSPRLSTNKTKKGTESIPNQRRSLDSTVAAAQSCVNSRLPFQVKSESSSDPSVQPLKAATRSSAINRCFSPSSRRPTLKQQSQERQITNSSLTCTTKSAKALSKSEQPKMKPISTRAVVAALSVDSLKRQQRSLVNISPTEDINITKTKEKNSSRKERFVPQGASLSSYDAADVPSAIDTTAILEQEEEAAELLAEMSGLYSRHQELDNMSSDCKQTIQSTLRFSHKKQPQAEDDDEEEVVSSTETLGLQDQHQDFDMMSDNKQTLQSTYDSNKPTYSKAYGKEEEPDVCLDDEITYVQDTCEESVASEADRIAGDGIQHRGVGSGGNVADPPMKEHVQFSATLTSSVSDDTDVTAQTDDATTVDSSDKKSPETMEEGSHKEEQQKQQELLRQQTCHKNTATRSRPKLDPDGDHVQDLIDLNSSLSSSRSYSYESGQCFKERMDSNECDTTMSSSENTQNSSSNMNSHSLDSADSMQPIFKINSAVSVASVAKNMLQKNSLHSLLEENLIHDAVHVGAASLASVNDTNGHPNRSSCATAEYISFSDEDSVVEVAKAMGAFPPPPPPPGQKKKRRKKKKQSSSTGNRVRSSSSTRDIFPPSPHNTMKKTKRSEMKTGSPKAARTQGGSSQVSLRFAC